MPILKSNEQTTREYNKEESDKFKELQSNIIKVTRELRELQKEYKSITGKRLEVF